MNCTFSDDVKDEKDEMYEERRISSSSSLSLNDIKEKMSYSGMEFGGVTMIQLGF
jgi:hypothetical protein